MRIIEEGSQELKEKKKTCRECKTKLAYTNADIMQDRDSEHIQCPVCNTLITVDYIL